MLLELNRVIAPPPREDGDAGGATWREPPMPAIPPFAVQSGEGKTLRTPTDDLVTVQADTAMTNGSLSVLELLIEPKSGPALHTHLREDELWFVLEGEFRFAAPRLPVPGVDRRHGVRAARRAARVPEPR
jgi:hypothetical protein